MASLVIPNVRYEDSYRESMREFVAEGRPEELRALPHHETFASFVHELHEQSQGRGLPEGWVSGSTFWLVDAEHVLGRVEVRHQLTESLRQFGGHSGYCVRPSQPPRWHGLNAIPPGPPRCLA